MKISTLSNFKSPVCLTRLTGNLPFVTAIAAFVTFAALPQSAFAADTWGYCVIIDNNGRLARFTNIFHYPFLVTKYDLKPSADRFKSDTNSSYRAAADCLIFNDESSAIKQREMNLGAFHGIGAHVDLTDYNVKYKNFPSTPPPKVASNSATQLPRSEQQHSPAPTAEHERPRVTVHNKNREQSHQRNNSHARPITQMQPHTRLSMRDAIAQAQAKTKRLRRQAGAAASSTPAAGTWRSTSKTGSGGAAICVAVKRNAKNNNTDVAYYYSYGRGITQYVAETRARKRLGAVYSSTPSCARSDENHVGALVVIAWQATDDSGAAVRTYGMGFGRSTGEAERQAVKNLSNRNWNWTRSKGYRVVYAKQY